MIDTSLDLSNKVPVAHVAIIRRVLQTAASLNLNLFIVGAQARDLILQYAYGIPVLRATTDFDFAFAAESWLEFAELRERLIARNEFKRDPRKEHRLLDQEHEAVVDLIPFGRLEEPAGIIAWPSDLSTVMSTLGFREAYENSLVIRLADDLVVRTASLAGLSLLKLIAWSDRKRKRERDAQDLGLLMRRYLDAGNQERLYSDSGDCIDLLLDKDFDYERASARVLGRDVGRLLSDESRLVVDRVLAVERDAASPAVLINAMIRNNSNYIGDFDGAHSRLVELCVGIAETT